MKAILVKESGGPDQLYLGTHPDPEPAADELLVRVVATALNRADIMQREGKYPPPPGASPVIGLEMAGVVERVGPACEGFSVGDHVFGLLPGGGYAEYVAIPYRMAMHVPEGMSMEEAASIPEAFLTAFQSLYWIGQMEAGNHVLVHAGASGVGTAAIQLVRAAGAHAYATASGPKLDFCQSVGAELAIDYINDDFVARVKEASKGHGADIIVDFIGASYFDRNMDVMALDGRLVILASLGGVKVDALDLRVLFKKRANIHASTLRSRSRDYQMRLTEDFRQRALPLFASGKLRAVVDQVYDWTDVQEAHRRMGNNENKGKLVLRVN